MIEEARKNGDDPAARYAILNAALDVAPDANVAVTVVDARGRWFDIDVLKEKASIIWIMSKKAGTIDENRAVVEAAVLLIDAIMEK